MNINNPRKKSLSKFKKSILLLLTAIFIITVSVFLPACNMLFGKSSFKSYKKNYSINELSQIKESSFVALNSIDYSALNEASGEVSAEYVAFVRNFASTIYAYYAQKNFNGSENFSFSPMGLYQLLHLMSTASEDETALQKLDSLLGSDKNGRRSDFVAAYKNDFFSNDNGTLQMYNAAFLTDKYAYNPAFVNDLSNHFAEAYRLDFNNNKAINQMLKWVDEKTDEKGFLKKTDLEIDANTMMIFMSTLYFNNKWASSFNTSDTYKDKFYGKTETTAEYMFHSYFGQVYDYGDYVSCYDHYTNGMKVKYFVPKETSNNIYSLLNGVDLHQDDESKLFGEEGAIIELSVPKFNSESLINFRQALSDLGLAYLFDSSNRSFNHAFTDLPADATVYLQYVKQKNKISFSEDGTIIKSVSVGAGKAKSAGPISVDTYEIKLNCPFVYVIYDKSGLPIYLGNMNAPDGK